jgi:hypothetical protein
MSKATRPGGNINLISFLSMNDGPFWVDLNVTALATCSALFNRSNTLGNG